MTDHPTDRLLLLTEAAELAGCTVEALRQRIKRGKIRPIKGNDGRVRVKLTPADVDALRAGRSTPTGQPTGQPVENDQAIKALEASVAMLREELEHERTERRDERSRLLAELERERARLDAAQAAQAAAEEERRRVAQDLRAAQDGRTQALRELADERSRPWWKRLFK